MAQKRNFQSIPAAISPFVWGYLVMLQKKAPIARAYLFGSWAKGTPHRWSDIDLAVVSPAFRDWERKRRLLSQVRLGADLSAIEPHGFHPKNFKAAENPVVHEIVKHGIRII